MICERMACAGSDFHMHGLRSTTFLAEGHLAAQRTKVVITAW